MNDEIARLWARYVEVAMIELPRSNLTPQKRAELYAWLFAFPRLLSDTPTDDDDARPLGDEGWVPRRWKANAEHPLVVAALKRAHKIPRRKP